MEDPKLALFLRAESFRLANNFEDAIPLYEKILELDPHDGGARKVLAELFLIYGDREKGVRAYWELAQEHRRRGEHDKVTPILRKIRVLDAGATLDVTQAALRMLAEIDAVGGDEAAAGGSERSRAELEEEERPEIKLDAPLFGSLPADELKKLVKALHMVRGRRGTILFREGDLTRSLFVIAEGAVEIRARTTTASGSVGESRVAQLGKGELFGEFSFLTGAPRSATARVSSTEDALLYMLSREAMDALAAEESAFVKVLDRYYRERALDLIFARSALFAGLPALDRQRIAACFGARSYPRGSVLIEEGKPGDDFYLVKAGEVEILRATSDGGNALLALLGPNQFFGEISFLMGKPRSASAIATSDAEILVISGEALRDVVAHYPSVRSQLEKARLRRAVETAKRLAGRGVTSPPLMTAPDEKFADFLSAEKARTQEKYTEAIRLFEKIIDKDPEEHGVRVVLGDLLLKSGDVEAALGSYHRAALAYRSQGHLARYDEVVARMNDADPEGNSELLRKLQRSGRKKGKGGKDSQERRAAPVLEEAVAEAAPDFSEVDLFSDTARLTMPVGRDEEDREELGDGVSITLTAPLFKDLSPQARARLVERMAVLNVRAGSMIYREGDPGSSLYVIGSGRAVLTFRGPGGKERVFAELGPGEFFGEFAFLTGSPRQFTVKVTQAGRIFQLARKSLEDLQKSSPALTATLFAFYRERVLDRVLAGSALFGSLTAEQRKAVADRFVLESYPCGSVIIAEGSRGDQLYLIRHGEVRVTASASAKQEEVFIASLCANDVFGEFSFLTGKPRAASVVAVSDAELLTVSRAGLEPVLSRHPEVLKAMKKVYFERMADNHHKLAKS